MSKMVSHANSHRASNLGHFSKPQTSFKEFTQACASLREQAKSFTTDTLNTFENDLLNNHALFPDPRIISEILSNEANDNQIVESLCKLLETLDRIIQSKIKLETGEVKSAACISKQTHKLNQIVEHLSFSILNAFFYPLAKDSRGILNEITQHLKTLNNPDQIIAALTKRHEDLVKQTKAIRAETASPAIKANFITLDPARRQALLHAVESRQAA